LSNFLPKGITQNIKTSSDTPAVRLLLKIWEVSIQIPKKGS